MKTILLRAKLVFRWILAIAFSLAVLLLLTVEVLDRYISTDKGAQWLFRNVEKKPFSIHRSAAGVRYLSIGDADKQPLLLIHGAPGSIFDWLSFAKRDRIYDQYRLLIVDRPGYGGSRPRRAEKSIEKQARHILEVLDGEERPAVVMGHSYGGPISVIMAAIEPQAIEKVIAVSGQYDPDNERVFQASYFVNFKIFRYLLPRMLWASNVEKLSHPDALRAILPLYGKIGVPVDVIHGDADTLVPYENSPFLMEKLKNNSEARLIRLQGYDHPLQMQEVDYLVDFALDPSTPPLPAKEKKSEVNSPPTNGQSLQ